jgi:hypothetical protein
VDACATCASRSIPCQHAQNREVDILVIEGAGPKVAEKYLVLGGGEVVGTGVEGPAEVEERAEARFVAEEIVEGDGVDARPGGPILRRKPAIGVFTEMFDSRSSLIVATAVTNLLTLATFIGT